MLFQTVATVSADVFISEFLSSNDGLLDDEDGNSPDWIEIHNDDALPVNLAGWHLTDNPGHLNKWTFPATNLPAGGHLVVFASGKNRAVAGAPLHANFSLGVSNYLALVRPNLTIAHEFSPTYPAQRYNVSYGLAFESSVTPLVTSGASARVLVPVNGNLGVTWTALTFVDSGWAMTNLPVGFAVGAVPTPVLSLDFNERAQSSPPTQEGFSSFVVLSNGGSGVIQTAPTTRTYGAISVTVSNTLPDGYDDRQRNSPVNNGAFTDSALLRDFIFSTDAAGNGGLDVTISGLTANHAHRFTIWSFDTGSQGARISDWMANGVTVKTGYTFNGSVLPTSNDQYRFSFDSTTDSAGKILISGRRVSSGSSYGVFLNALKVESLNSVPATNGLALQMLSNNATAYLRIPFNVTDPNQFDFLKLRIKYDDGFVAYINGQPVASRNAPGSPQWNSTATAANLNADSAEEIIIGNTPGLLVSGANVLAIHGLNVNAGDSDFAMAPELEGIVSGAYTLRYFQPPTPAEPNDAGYFGLVAEPQFSMSRGFYSAPFNVTLSCPTPGASIYWTTNGSTPSATNGFLYSTPVPVNTTTCLRAVAVRDGFVPSESITHTYIFLNHVLQQPDVIPGYPTVWQAGYPADYGMDPNVVNHPTYSATISNDLRSIPTLSIVTDHDHLWHPTTGIYVDATQSGDFWERPASVELFDGNNVSQFQINCALQMQGNASRDNNRLCKHSFQLLFKSGYGPSKLEYAWFPGPVIEFDTVILRACFTDAWGTRYSDQNTFPGGKGTRYRPEDSIYLRDVWMKDTMRDMGHLSGRNNFVHLYVNGLYWGLYNPTERLDADFFASHLGGSESDWDVIRDASELLDGSKADWNAMMALCNEGIDDEADFQAVAALVDIDNLIDYMLLHIYAEAEDWPSHNWYAAHRRANPVSGLPATKWIFLPWDQEIVLDQLVTFERINVSNNDTPARIYSRLRNYSEFRRMFGDRIQKHFFNGGALSPSNNIARLQARAAQIDRAIVGESARWGDAREFTIGANPGHGQTFTRDEWWLPELLKLYTNWFPNLNEKNLARFRSAGLYPNLGAPVFSQFGGSVPQGFALTITHTNSSGSIYYTLDGSDPRTYGTGAVSPSAQAYGTPIPITSVTLVRARVFDGSEWSALVEASFAPPQNLNHLAVTEIMYNPPDLGGIDGNDLEFLELKNFGGSTLDLSGLTFTAGITFTFPNNTLLGPGQFFVLARNASAFNTKYPGVTVNGTFTGQFNNSGETVTLSFPGGGNVFSLTYEAQAPWPVTPDGLGFSLVPKQPGVSQAPDNPASWRASAQAGGSPGADDPVPGIAPIVVNELLAHTDPPQRDAIELFNPTTTNVNISGWYLTDDAGTPAKYRIPNGTILLPGAYWYVDDTQFNSGANGNIPFAFSSTGEEVYLFSADVNTGQLTGYSHGTVFGATFNGVALQRFVNSEGEEFFPQEISITLGAPNSGPRIGPIVFNEIHYHPENGGVEFVEFLNISNNVATLYDVLHPTNTWDVNGLSFNFPMGVSLQPGELCLVVGNDPATFRSMYNVPAEVQIFGPFGGALQNDGERLALEAPDNPNVDEVPYVTMEEVRYNDNMPWPPGADGGGQSLQRISPTAFGSEPLNWLAAAPTPGRLFADGDSDGDGLPNGWEMANGTNWQVADGDADPDHDGLTNLQEFQLGTNPQVAENLNLSIERVSGDSGAVRLSFEKISGVGYVIEQSPTLVPPDWTELITVPATPQSGVTTITNQISPNSSRYYRLRIGL